MSMSAAGAVHAGDLDAANRLLAGKQYREALQAFGQLASAGSAAWKQATLAAMAARNKEMALWHASVGRHETYRAA